MTKKMALCFHFLWIVKHNGVYCFNQMTVSKRIYDGQLSKGMKTDSQFLSVIKGNFLCYDFYFLNLGRKDITFLLGGMNYDVNIVIVTFLA